MPLDQLLRDAAVAPVPAHIDTSPVGQRAWEAAVGTRIAARARPVRLDRGVLVVRTASSTWAQELALLSGTIIDQLRAQGIDVQSLRFRVGEVEPLARPPWRNEVRTAPARAALPAAVIASLGDVPDEELRRAIAIAASTNLGWQAMTAKAFAPKGHERGPEAPQARAASDEATPAPAPAKRAAKSAPDEPATSARRGARAPRSAASESAPPDRSSTPSPARRRDKP